MKKTTLSAAVTFAVQVRAMCGNKEAQAAVRVDMIRAAILVAVKGNSTDWKAGAAEAAQGKGAVAKALAAGFDAVGVISVAFKPQDAKAMTAPQKQEAIDAAVSAHLEAFMAAFDAEMPKEPTEAEKQAKKEEREAAAAAKLSEAVEAAIAERGLVSADSIATDGEIFNAALALFKAGKFGPALVEEMRAALNVPAMLAQAFNDGKAAALAEAVDTQSAAQAISKAAQAISKAAAPRRGKGKGKAAQAEAAAPVFHIHDDSMANQAAAAAA